MSTCRIVKVDLSNPGPHSEWQDVVPQHDKDLLEWACALKVSSQLIPLSMLLSLWDWLALLVFFVISPQRQQCLLCLLGLSTDMQRSHAACCRTASHGTGCSTAAHLRVATAHSAAAA